MRINNFQGVITPVLTPFNDDGSIADDLYSTHCNWLMNEGSHYIAPFGTTGEALSLSLAERVKALESLVVSGNVPAERLMPGTGLCSLPETVELTRHAVELGCMGVLTLPPFFYVNANDEGLYRYFSSMIEKVGLAELKICLYHIPPFARIGFSPELAYRLNQSFPNMVVAYKDSSGLWENTQTVIKTVPDLSVFPGSEMFLVRALEGGGAGCISATCNINVRKIRQVYDKFYANDIDGFPKASDQMIGFRKIIQDAGPISIMKALLSAMTDEKRWKNVKSPLIEVDKNNLKAVIGALGTQLDHLKNCY